MAQRIDWRTVAVSVAASAALFLFCSLLLVYGLMPRYLLQMQMAGQPLSIELPPSMPVQVKLSEPINARFDAAFKARVPIDQALPMRINDRMNLDVHFDADIPLDFEVVIDDEIEVDSLIKTQLMGVPLTLPIKGRLPVKMVVPIAQPMPLKFTAPISVDLKEEFVIHLNTVLDTEVEIHDTLSIPVPDALDTDIRMRPDTPIQVQVGTEQLSVPLGTMRLKPAPED